MASMYGGQGASAKAKGFQQGYKFQQDSEAAMQEAEIRSEKIKKSVISSKAKEAIWNDYASTDEASFEINQLKGQVSKMEKKATGSLAKDEINHLLTSNSTKDREIQLRNTITKFKANPKVLETLGIKNLDTVQVIYYQDVKNSYKVLELFNKTHGTNIEYDDPRAKNIINEYPAIMVDGHVVPLNGLGVSMGATNIATVAQQQRYENNTKGLATLAEVPAKVRVGSFGKTGTTSVADRFNNPLNIVDSDFTRKRGGVNSGSKESQAKFPTWDDGVKAARDLITSKNYRNKTVDGVLGRWAESHPPAYTAYVLEHSGVPANLAIKDMSPNQVNAVMKAMYEWESGNRTDADPQAKQYQHISNELQSYSSTGKQIGSSRLSVLQSLAGDTVTDRVLGEERYTDKEEADTAFEKNYEFIKQNMPESKPNEIISILKGRSATTPAKMKEVTALQSMQNPKTGKLFTESEAIARVYGKDDWEKQKDKIAKAEAKETAPTAHQKDSQYDRDRTYQGYVKTYGATLPKGLVPEDLGTEADSRGNKALFTTKMQAKIDKLEDKSMTIIPLRDVKEAFSKKGFKTGYIDNVASFLKEKGIADVTSLVGMDFDETQLANQLGSIEAAKLLKVMSGAAATDQEFARTLFNIIGDTTMDEVAKRTAIANYINQYEKTYKSEINGIRNSFPVTAYELGKPLGVEEELTTVNKGADYADLF